MSHALGCIRICSCIRLKNLVARFLHRSHSLRSSLGPSFSVFCVKNFLQMIWPSPNFFEYDSSEKQILGLNSFKNFRAYSNEKNLEQNQSHCNCIAKWYAAKSLEQIVCQQIHFIIIRDSNRYFSLDLYSDDTITLISKNWIPIFLMWKKTYFYQDWIHFGTIVEW